MADNLLDIKTLIERPVVAIDGIQYEITAPEEMSIVDAAKVARLGRRLDAKMKLDHPTPADETALRDILADLIAIIMKPVPEEVRSKLGDAQKLAVIEVFTMLLLARKARLAGGTMVRQLAGQAFADLLSKVPQAAEAAAATEGATGAATGEKSSADASGSTAAIHGAG